MITFYFYIPFCCFPPIVKVYLYYSNSASRIFFFALLLAFQLAFTVYPLGGAARRAYAKSTRTSWRYRTFTILEKFRQIRKNLTSLRLTRNHFHNIFSARFLYRYRNSFWKFTFKVFHIRIPTPYTYLPAIHSTIVLCDKKFPIQLCGVIHHPFSPSRNEKKKSSLRVFINGRAFFFYISFN